MRIVADSSVWISLITAAPGHDHYLPLLQPPFELLVPALVVSEVMRWSLVRRGGEAALAAQQFLERQQVVALDADIAADAAWCAHDYKLAMADAIILAAARARSAELWSQDADFENLPGVRYFSKLSRP